MLYKDISCPFTMLSRMMYTRVYTFLAMHAAVYGRSRRLATRCDRRGRHCYCCRFWNGQEQHRVQEQLRMFLMCWNIYY